MPSLLRRFCCYLAAPGNFKAFGRVAKASLRDFTNRRGSENERKKLELEQKKLDYQMECLRYQISGAQGDEKTEAIKEFLEAVNPTNEQIDELYDEIESEEVSEDDACDGEENGS